MTQSAVVVGFFRGLFSIEGMLEKAEAKAVLRALRIIYFYPDKSVSRISKVANSLSPSERDLREIKNIFEESSSEVKEAIDLLSSPSVRTNLRIPIDIQDAISRSVDTKLGIREIYAGMVWDSDLGESPEKLRDAASRALNEINLLNRQLAEIETAIQKSE